jgi:hypothetical protein
MHQRRGEIGRTEILIGVAVVAVLALIAVPLGLNRAKNSKLSEVPMNVDLIRISEINYSEAFQSYVAATAAPREAHAVDDAFVKWEPTAGFKKLSWAPEAEEVRGSYQVRLTEGGFEVEGVCDVDGDGQRAIFKATQDEEAKQTNAGTY